MVWKELYLGGPQGENRVDLEYSLNLLVFYRDCSHFHHPDPFPLPRVLFPIPLLKLLLSELRGVASLSPTASNVSLYANVAVPCLELSAPRSRMRGRILLERSTYIALPFS